MGTADSGTRGHSSPAADWLDLQCPDRQQLYSPLMTKTTPDKHIRFKALKLTHFHVNEAKLVLSNAWDKDPNEELSTINAQQMYYVVRCLNIYVALRLLCMGTTMI